MKLIESEGKLSLTSDGATRIFFIGVGSAFSKRLYQNNLVIIKGKDHLLVDCGTRCTQALSELGLKITDFDNFLITHSHADHIGGLEEAALMSRYFAKKKPLMVINETYEKILWDMSLRGGCAYNEEKEGKVLEFGDFWKVLRPKRLSDYPRETMEGNINSINIKMFRTKHVPETAKSWKESFWSCGIIIDNKIFFSSDSRYDEELVLSYERMFNFEIIFHDCQFFTGGVHASLEELKELPPEIKEKMILTHYGDNWEKFEEKVKKYGFAGLNRQQVYYEFD